MEEYVLAPNEIESLKESLGAYIQVLGATEDGYISGEQGAGPVLAPGMRVNRRKLTDQAKQIKDVLDKCSPRQLNPAEKDKLHEENKKLEELFKPYLETRKELHVLKRDSAEWQSAIEKARIRTQINPKIERAINKWKMNQRLLDPGNPDADNLHRLRLEKATGT